MPTPAILAGGPWENVTAPVGWTWVLPFTIQRRRRQFRVDPSFDLRTHANISVTKTYYVDKATGNNGNTGADWANALADPKTAFGKADVDRVVIKAGYYFLGECNAAPTRSLEILADSGLVTISADCRNDIGAWTAVDNHYEATVGASRTVARVMDAATPNVFGNDSTLTSRASVALVDANAGSWNQTGTTIAVRTADDRAPDASLRYFTTASAFIFTQDSKTLYVEGVRFLRGVAINNASATGGLKVYFKNCSVASLQCNGVDEIIAWGCQASRSSGDGFSHSALNGVVPNVIEVNCEAYDGGTSGTDQASTTHDGITSVRINGRYHDVAGQCVADVNAAVAWLLGCEFHHSTSGIGYYTAGTAWLDRCSSHDNSAYDLQNTVGSTIRTRQFAGAKGVNDIGGTLETY